MPDPANIFRFGGFELDVTAYELRHEGRRVRLERQPMDVLILLVQNRQRLVSRADIIDKLWGKDVFVDVETGIHTVIRKIRHALADPAQAPAFVETVTGKGYRFIGDVETAAPSANPAAGPPGPVDVLEAPAALPTATPARRRWIPLMAVLSLVLATGVAAWAWRTRASIPSAVAVAVLPFENLSGDADRDYLAEGLTEETIAAIGQIDPAHIHVLSRRTVKAYLQSGRSVAELGADYRVETSIRGEGERLRLTVNLIRTRDQLQVWSASYDRAPTGVLALQQALSTAIAEQIRLRISPERLKQLAKRQTSNPEAYDLYLRGRSFWNRLTPATNRLAVERYQRAIALDAQYALAWSGIADAFYASAINSDAYSPEEWTRARDAAARAVAAQPDLAEAQTSLGAVEFWLGWDWVAAEAAFRRAVALDPSYALAQRLLGHLLSQTNRHEEAREALRRARDLDPLYAMNEAVSSQLAFQARDYPAAVEHARQTIAIDQDFWVGYVQLGQVYAEMSEPGLALEALAKATQLSNGNSKPVSLRGFLLAKSGRQPEAREVLRSLEAASRTRYVPPYALALLHAGLGERDLAFDFLEKAYASHDVHLVFLPVDPKWDPYRGDPRFEQLLARCGFMRVATKGG